MLQCLLLLPVASIDIAITLTNDVRSAFSAVDRFQRPCRTFVPQPPATPPPTAPPLAPSEPASPPPDTAWQQLAAHQTLRCEDDPNYADAGRRCSDWAGADCNVVPGTAEAHGLDSRGRVDLLLASCPVACATGVQCPRALTCDCQGGLVRRLALLKRVRSAPSQVLLDAGGYFSGSELLFPLVGINASAEAFAASRYHGSTLNWRDFLSGAPPAGTRAYVRAGPTDITRLYRAIECSTN
eukprot:2900455-Prymnesium_polylepis.1